jgi:hypothetical protein
MKLYVDIAAIIYDTDTVTSRLFRKSFNCRYNPRMDYAFCLLTLKSSNNVVYLSFDIYKIIMTSCQTFYCTNEKGKCEKTFFFVITDQDYPCQHIDQWPRKTRESTTALATKKKKNMCTHKTSYNVNNLYIVLIFFLIFSSHVTFSFYWYFFLGGGIYV